MTPEERAAKAYEDWREGKTVGHPALSYRIDDLPTVITAHIRAAENDALERAALAADWYNVHAPYGDAKHPTAGEHIRALKIPGADASPTSYCVVCDRTVAEAYRCAACPQRAFKHKEA